MAEFDEDFVVPEDSINKGFPKKIAKENAFYTAELTSEQDPVLESPAIANDLEFDGTNPQYEEALERWQEIQEVNARDTTIGIISDPELDSASKVAVVRDFKEGKFSQDPIREQYIQSVASKDYEPSGEEDLPLRQEDIEAQEIFLDKIEENLDTSDEVQKMKTSYLASLNNSTLSSIAGLTMEVLSPLDLHGLRSAYNAHNAGVKVTNNDILGGDDSRLGVAIDPDDSSLTYNVFQGLVKTFEASIAHLDTFLFDIPRNFLFSGSLNKKVGDVFEQSTPEQRKEMLSSIMESLDDIPGTDIQKWLVFQEQVELEGQDPLVALVGDIAGFAGAAGAAAFFRDPIKGVKWYTTFEKTDVPSFFPKAKQVVDSSDEISTKAEDVVKPAHKPTGSGNVNATDNITVSTEDITTLPTESVTSTVDTYLAKAGENYSELKARASNKVFVKGEDAFEQPKNLVKNDKGETVEFFHTTNKEFDEFKAGDAGGAIFFTDDKSFIDNINKVSPEGKPVNVKKVNLALEDTFDFNNKSSRERVLKEIEKDLIKERDDKLARGNVPEEFVRKDFERKLASQRKELEDLSKGDNNWASIESDRFQRLIKQAGFDSFKVKEEGVVNTAVYDPEKIITPGKKIPKKDSIVVNLSAEEVEKRLPEVKVSKKDLRKAQDLLRDKDDTDLRLIGSKLGMDAKDIPSKELLDRVSKTMAERAARIEASKEFKNADRKFVKSNRVEVKEAKVEPDGSFSNIDMIDYNVMRANGMDVIPVSMGLDSTINAVSNGMVNRIPSQPTIFDNASLTRMARPGVDPNSPAGLTQKANPVKAVNDNTEALRDTTEATAEHLGTTKGDIIYDSVLPKLDISLEETFPNVADNLRKIDEDFTGRIKDPGVHLLDEAGRKQKEIETTAFLKTFKENTTGTYNQANSTVHIGDQKASGIATYGRTNSYGWATREEATEVLKNLKAHNPKFPLRIVERNNSFWIEQEWDYQFNHIDRWMFNEHSMDTRVLGVDTSFLSRSAIGDWIFPTPMKGDPNLAKVGAIAELKANKNEAAFFGLIRKEILATPHKDQLKKAMNITQEEGRWIKPSEFAIEFPELNKQQLESLANSYYSYKRGSDYAYEFANKIHRRQLQSKDFQGVYTKDGNILGYGKEVSTRPKEVYDFSDGTGKALPSKLEGKRVVELSETISVDGKLYKHALADENINIGKLPNRTLPKVEGWVPRRNKENWFIDFTPSRTVVDGEEIIDKDVLTNYSKTLGAGRTRKEAELFAKQLKKDFPNGELKVREATENLSDTSLADYTLYKDTTSTIKKRGDRLKTLHGFSRLEDPLEAFAETTRTITRINAWQPLKETFENSFLKFADEFIPSNRGVKVFPNDINGLVLRQGSSPEEIKRFKVAQRLLSQYKEMQYNATFGDRAWRSVFNNIANILEDVGFLKPVFSEFSREIAKQGDLLTKILKTLASHLFIYLNPLRQWLLQPQQLLELNLISPEYAKRAPTEIPSIIAAVVSRAPHMKKYNKIAYEAAKKASLMDGKEFDDIVNAVYDSGLPQAVDLNQMLYGTWASSKFEIDPSIGRRVADFSTNVVSAPGRIGKTIGYTPAEMANNIGAWLFSLDRWKKLNPGKNWNTPDNIARITADSWDINHSMIGRAGTMPFQKGSLGVLFQFMAIQQKGFMQLLSSKTLTFAEKVKLAVARLALYGGYGVPMGAIGLVVIDKLVDEYASEEVQQIYHANKGGIVDALTNTTLAVMFADPGTKWDVVKDQLVGKGKSDISMSKALTPIPDTVPLYDMLVQFTDFTDNNKTNPRFPGPQALGSLSEAVSDIKTLWNANTITTGEKLALAARGLSEVASGFNNYGKAMVMKQYRDKLSKTGNTYGLDITEGEILAQAIGFTTREEELMWANIEVKKDRDMHLSEVANEVFRRFQKMERILGEPEYETAVNRLNELLELSVEEEDLPEVKSMVEAKMKKAFKSGDIKTNLYEEIFNVRKNINNENHKEMIRNIRQSAVRNEGDKRVIDMLEHLNLEEKQ